MVLDGTESWQKSGLDNNAFFVSLSDLFNPRGTADKTVYCFSNCFIGSYRSNLSNLSYCILASYDDTSQNGNLLIKCSGISTVNEFIEFVTNNNVIVYYTLAEPETISLGNLSSLIKTYSGTNNIWIESNLETTIDVVYAQDLNVKCNNLQSQIDELRQLINTPATGTTLEMIE